MRQILDEQDGRDEHEDHRGEACRKESGRVKTEQVEHRAETQQHEESACDVFGDEIRRQFPMPVDLVLCGVRSLHHVLSDASANLNGTVERLALSLRGADGRARFGFQNRQGDCSALKGSDVLLGDLVRPHVGVVGLRGRRMQRPIIAVDVEQFGSRPLFRLANAHLRSGQLSAYFRSGVVQVASENRMFGADHHTGGFESHIQTMRAEGAFGGGIGFGVEIDRVVGTGLHTGFTSDADAWVELDDTVVALIHGADGTDAHARRVGAVVAARHLKAAAHIGVGACLHILDPCAIHAKRHLILGLARSTARMATDTLALVN